MLEKTLNKALPVDGERDKNLVFYSLSTCAMCKKGLRYLEERGYAYKLLYVDQLALEEKEQLKEELSLKYGMRVVFPALAVDDDRIVLGFIRTAWDQALGETSDGNREN